MATTKQIAVKDLNLDLKNFRTVEQPNELEAVKAMISINPDKFWGLMESILEDGYLPTESIIAIKGTAPIGITVKEGNRRVAVLKIIFGIIPLTQLGIPNSTQQKITRLTLSWSAANKKVPCTLFEADENQVVDRIVSRTHGKGEKASRDPWTSVATARHNRDINGVTEYGLDLLEKYLSHGRNLTPQQKERFAGDFPLSILDSAIHKVYTRVGAATATDFISTYPNTQYFTAIEAMLMGIGLKQIRTDEIRSSSDFAVPLGFPPATPPTPPTPTPSPAPTPSPTTTPTPAPSPTTTPTPAPTPSPQPTPTPSPAPQPPAVATNTPKSVENKMKLFRPRGNGREKIVDLKDEVLQLNLSKSPIAFCFLLRSLFDISAKVYCAEKGIATTYSNRNGGTFDRKLTDLLTDTYNNLTVNGTNQGMVRQLHGGYTQLNRPESILSVTSMNQLVHNPNFSVAVGDVCVLFHNVYQFLEAMN